MEENLGTTLRLMRLDIIKEQLTSFLRKCKEDFKSGIWLPEDISLATRTLKIKNDRFISELSICISEGKLNAHQVKEYTVLQLDTEQLIVELEMHVKNKSNQTKTTDQQMNASKLPQLELATFSGNILKFHEFWDSFTASVESKNIRDVDKLAYLKLSLKGDAKKVIEGLDTTDRNFSIAVQSLKERYGKPGIVVDAHYKELYNLKRKGDSIKESRQLFNEIESHLRILSSLGENTNGAHLRGLIIDKFPESIQYDLRTRMKSDEEPIPEIRKHLELIITAREATADNRVSNEFTTDSFLTRNLNSKGNNRSNMNNNNQRVSQYKTTDNHLGRKRKYNNEHAMNATTFNKKKARISCVFCGDNHFNDSCHKYRTIQERKGCLQNKCFICFRDNHKSNQCLSKVKCYHCGLRHNSAMCPKNEVKPSTSGIKSDVKTMHVKNECHSILPTAIAWASNGAQQYECRILLDSGSQRSYISAALAHKLKLEPLEENSLTVYTFGTNEPKIIDSSIVEFEIITKKNIKRKIHANTVQYITNNIPGPDPTNLDPNIMLADDGSLGKKIDMLIGIDYYQHFMHDERKQIMNRFFLLNSDFGWIAAGVELRDNEQNVLSVTTYVQSVTESQHTLPDTPLEHTNSQLLWELEAIGIHDSPKESREEEALRFFNDTLLYKDNRYEVKWPWITYPAQLPTNLGLAFGRLENMMKGLNQETKISYDAILQQQKENGIIEEVNDEMLQPAHPVHYLAHHCIVKPDKSTVHRIVYDGSAKLKDNTSLNECLYKGPSMLQNLTSLLIQFRVHDHAIIADIEKAFLQIGLQEEDRDVTRFLWIRDINKKPSYDNIVHMRFRRVPFGIISSPFILAATIKHHLNKTNTDTAKQIDQNMYVDNLITGTDNDTNALNLYNEAKDIFSAASMNLRQWNSNNKEFLKKIPEEQRENKIETNVLGLTWNVDKDTLSLKIPEEKIKEMESRNVTKRDILKIMASFYDPCGYIAPFLLPIKLLLQKTWEEKLKWESKLTEDMLPIWNKWKEEIKYARYFEIPRRYFTHEDKTPNKDYELHCFTDASNSAFSAVVYLRKLNGDTSEVSFVIGKSRLTPTADKNELKIPKLELLGVLIGNRLILYVEKTLNITIKEQYLWTDSQIVLSWINSNKLLPPFVEKRIQEIKNNTKLKFKYINTKDNPADIATRPFHNNKHVWINGPQFLKRKDDWPQTTMVVMDTTLTILEGEDLPKSSKNKETTIPEQNLSNHEQYIHVEKEQLEEIKKLQADYFPEEYSRKMTDIARSLRVFKDENGILRCKGRLENTNWPVDQKYPILIPKKADFTKRIIEEVHNKNYHVGVSHTLNLIRNQYWIPQGRDIVRRTIAKCIKCKKYTGGPYKLPQMPQLPKERVNLSSPFTYMGLDYLGPMKTQNEIDQVNKRWICIYTCLSTRAIHLEVIQDLTAEECSLALRRFIASRGLPACIISDNATQFKLTADVLTGPYCIENNIQWKFIPELAPWYGGFYERLVALVKHCFIRTLEKHLLKDNQLQTVTKEIEAVLNTRPLTYVPGEPEHILTPADFLRAIGPITTNSSEKEFLETATTTKTNLIEGWKRGQLVIDEFSKMFSNQYLNSLRERKGKHKEPKVVCNVEPKVGDIVQIKADKNRTHWKVGKISEIIPSTDGQIRVAKVKLPGGETFTRSISHLYPLEVIEDNSDDSNQINQQVKDDTPETSIKELQLNKERRATAMRARELIKKWTNDLKH